MSRVRKSVSRILAVGAPPADRVRRLTRGDHFTCVAGSEEEHEVLRTFCRRLEALLEETGLEPGDLSPEELGALARSLPVENGDS